MDLVVKFFSLPLDMMSKEAQEASISTLKSTESSSLENGTEEKLIWVYCIAFCTILIFLLLNIVKQAFQKRVLCLMMQLPC